MTKQEAIEKYLAGNKHSSEIVGMIEIWSPEKTISENAEYLNVKYPYAITLAKRYGLSYRAGLTGRPIGTKMEANQ